MPISSSSWPISRLIVMPAWSEVKITFMSIHLFIIVLLRQRELLNLSIQIVRLSFQIMCETFNFFYGSRLLLNRSIDFLSPSRCFFSYSSDFLRLRSRRPDGCHLFIDEFSISINFACNMFHRAGHLFNGYI